PNVFIGKGTHKRVQLAIDLLELSPKAFAKQDKSFGNEAELVDYIKSKNSNKPEGLALGEYLNTIMVDQLFETDLENKLTGNNISLSIKNKYTANILQGLTALHEEGIYHQDIKPQNIFIGQDDKAYIEDWGCSGKNDEQEPIGSPTIGGTALYSSPEIVELWHKFMPNSQDKIEQMTSYMQKGDAMQEPHIANDVYAMGLVLCYIYKNDIYKTLINEKIIEADKISQEEFDLKYANCYTLAFTENNIKNFPLIRLLSSMLQKREKRATISDVYKNFQELIKKPELEEMLIDKNQGETVTDKSSVGLMTNSYNSKLTEKLLDDELASGIGRNRREKIREKLRNDSELASRIDKDTGGPKPP
ncbi:MAG: protein kinase, partial [Romboutsia sp.]|nr:protein kinase [Romboutsia sp.]